MMAAENVPIMQRGLRWAVAVMLIMLFVIPSNADLGSGRHTWERPGCHKVGHTRKVTIPECVEFTVVLNACRGFCESFSIPSAWSRLQSNPARPITSVGQCCNIMETEPVTVNVMCIDGPRQLSFKSAKTCSCYHCKKD